MKLLALPACCSRPTDVEETICSSVMLCLDRDVSREQEECGHPNLPLCIGCALRSSCSPVSNGLSLSGGSSGMAIVVTVTISVTSSRVCPRPAVRVSHFVLVCRHVGLRVSCWVLLCRRPAARVSGFVLVLVCRNVGFRVGCYFVVGHLSGFRVSHFVLVCRNVGFRVGCCLQNEVSSDPWTSCTLSTDNTVFILKSQRSRNSEAERGTELPSPTSLLS